VTFREAYGYVLAYFEQLARLLVDGTTAMEKHGYAMLRPQGNSLVGGQMPAVGQAETWLSSWLFGFYAPISSFGGRRYGVSASAVRTVPFIGVGLYGPEVELPALYVGWVEPIDVVDDIVEKRLGNYYGAIEPAKLTPIPEPVRSIENVGWTLAAHATEPVRVALARVPMELVTGPRVLEELIRQLHDALGGTPV
jgi:hypothetical protein